MIILIYRSCHSDRNYLNSKSWRRKIERLGNRIVIWDKDFDQQHYPVVASWAALVAQAREINTDLIILVQADQWFLDTDICIQGLKNSRQEWDYFTQWEHARLPVGIGIRALRLGNNRLDCWKGNPRALIRHIMTLPNHFKMRIDPYPYTPFQDSFLDTTKTVPNTDENDDAPDSGLLDFLKHYKNRALAYKSEEDHPVVDERLLPSGYGFESYECAQFPTYIMFDITNACNAACIHCPHSSMIKKSRGSRFMDFNTYRKAIDECKKHQINFIRITADGEPLLHHRLADMVAYATENNAGPVGLTTNGSLMTKSMAKRLIESGLFLIDFSVDAIRENSYAKIRKGLSYHSTMENITDFINLNHQQGTPVKVMVSFVCQDINRDEKDEFKAFWQGKVDNVLFRDLISNINMVETDQKIRPQGIRWPCPHFFRRIVINYDGMLKACPVDWQNRTICGSINESNIAQAWHGDFYWKSRINHLNLDFDDRLPCRDCLDWQGTPWDLGYEKVIQQIKKGELN